MTDAPSSQQPPSQGEWLRIQRKARGWNVPQMRTRLRQAAAQDGDTLPGNESLLIMMHQWEADLSTVSLPYRINYCQALGIDPAVFGTAPPPTPPPAP